MSQVGSAPYVLDHPDRVHTKLKRLRTESLGTGSVLYVEDVEEPEEKSLIEALIPVTCLSNPIPEFLYIAFEPHGGGDL
jgi:hypothetical protein